jgi:hypothetical protein
MGEKLSVSEKARAQMASLSLDPKEWILTPEAEAEANCQMALLYKLKDLGEIKSFVLKSHRDNVRGIRLWSRSSIRAYLARKFEEALSAGNPDCEVSWTKDKAAS